MLLSRSTLFLNRQGPLHPGRLTSLARALPLGPLRSLSRILLVLLLTAGASGCRLAAGIFKAGFWTGIIVVVLVVVGLAFLIGKARG
jgi:hypothetical protein